MLNREQRLMLLKARRTPNCLFSQVPMELIHIISTSAQDETEFNTALHHVTFGELGALRTLLETAKSKAIQANTTTSKEVFLNPLKELLFNRGQTITPGGMTIKHSTLLESAFLSGDPEMVAMIKPYFSEVEGGLKEMESQLARCRPCIDAMMTQQAEDLTWLFNIIKAASARDVAEELKTGDQYEKLYQSPLRDALNQWRQVKLAPHNRVIDVLRAPRMFCNYQNWIHVNAFLDAEWDKNQWADLKINGNNYDKIYLILRQLRGLLELLELPVCERFAFANGQVEKPAAQIVRSLKYKYGDGSFPHFDRSSLEAHTGLGFDFYMSIFGAVGWAGAGGGPGWPGGSRFKTYVEQKLQTCRTYAATTTEPSTDNGQVCNRLK